MRTKWQILQEKLANARENLRRLEAEVRYLENTKCLRHDGVHISCGTCGVEFETEADFAKHYLVPDERYTNIGRCPKAFEQEAMDAYQGKRVKHKVYGWTGATVREHKHHLYELVQWDEESAPHSALKDDLEYLEPENGGVPEWKHP